MQILTMSFSIVALMISLPAIAISLYTLVEIKAFQRSTHKVEFMPVPEPDIETLAGKKQKREFMEGFNPDMTDDFIV